MKEVGNLSLSISLEGFEEVNDLRRGAGVYEKVLHAMDLLKASGQIFGTSICYTSKNIETVTSDEFLDMIIEKIGFPPFVERILRTLRYIYSLCSFVGKSSTAASFPTGINGNTM